MNPPSPEVVNSAVNTPVLAAIIALAFGLVKVLVIEVQALVKKYGKPQSAQAVEIQFDPEVSKRISDMSEQVDRMSNVMGKTDNDGTPMVYSSRSGMEAVRDIAVIIRSVSTAQERLARVMERLEERFVDHDKTDAATFHQMNSSLERLVKAFDDHDRRVADHAAVQTEILQKLKEALENK
jgi:hypothetical protein